jgi:hypothetical protein
MHGRGVMYEYLQSSDNIKENENLEDVDIEWWDNIKTNGKVWPDFI